LVDARSYVRRLPGSWLGHPASGRGHSPWRERPAVSVFSAARLAEDTIEALAQPEAFADVRVQARQTVLQDYDFERISLPAYLRLLET
jgi:hypothetical protein